MSFFYKIFSFNILWERRNVTFYDLFYSNTKKSKENYLEDLPPPRPPLSPMPWLSLDWDQQWDYEDEDKTCSDGAEDHRRLPVPPILFQPSLFETSRRRFHSAALNATPPPALLSGASGCVGISAGGGGG